VTPSVEVVPGNGSSSSDGLTFKRLTSEVRVLRRPSDHGFTALGLARFSFARKFRIARRSRSSVPPQSP